MINRALIVAIIIASLCIAGLVGYASATRYRPPSVPAGILTNADGEQRPPKAPKVFEKYVEAVMPAWILELSESKGKIIDFCPAQTLRFSMEAGNRAEGEVITTKDHLFIYAIVRDPYGNIIVENTARKYPWRFAFSAVITGEYSLGVNTAGGSVGWNIGGAHLKVTVYEK